MITLSFHVPAGKALDEPIDVPDGATFANVITSERGNVAPFLASLSFVAKGCRTLRVGADHSPYTFRRNQSVVELAPLAGRKVCLCSSAVAPPGGLNLTVMVQE